jgi:hypothetical protein
MAEPSTVKKPSRLGLILPFVLLLLVVGGWTAWWFFAAGRLNAGVDKWIARQAEKGAEFSYAGRSLTGYPFRFELAFDSPRYKGASGVAEWRGDRAEFVMQSWNLTHMIGRMPGHSVIVGADGILNSVDLDGTAAFSVSWNKAGLRRLAAQSGDAQALISGRSYLVSNLSLNFAPRPESPDDLMVAVQWDKITLDAVPNRAPYLGTELGPSRLIGEVRGFFPAYEATGRDVRGVWPALLENGGAVEVAQGLLDWGPLDLGGQANLEIANGRVNGAFKVRLDNAEALKQAMIDTGTWTQQAQMIVGTVEPASRDGGFLTLPVIDNGVFVGPVPLGKLPGTGS